MLRVATVLCLAVCALPAAAQSLEAITFASEKGRVYVPVRELAAHLEIPVGWRDEDRTVTLDKQEVPAKSIRRGWEGETLVDVMSLDGLGLSAEPFEDGSGLWITTELGQFEVAISSKWVEISIDEQRLIAGQGNRIVMETPISSGKRGHSTPRGSFTAGPNKQRTKYSSIYNNAPMPYSVQVHGNIFIHGSSSVPRTPASHGCIRMPLTGRNAARWFFDWVTIGAPVRVQGSFSEAVQALRSADIDADSRPNQS